MRRIAMMLGGLAVSAGPACAQDTSARVRPHMIALADSAQRVLRRLGSDTNFETAPGLTDDQRLMVGTCPANCRYGPRARIQPHRGGYQKRQVPPDSGMIIARIINDDNIAYGKFNLHARDTVYWAIGMRGNKPVSIFYSSREPGARPYYSNLEVDNHDMPKYQQATARWLWHDRDEEA